MSVTSLEHEAQPTSRHFGNRLTIGTISAAISHMLTSRRRDPARLFPTDPPARAIAAELYGHIADAPILSPHGHVPADLLANDLPFVDPAELLVTNDHYVTRLLHSGGVELSQLGLGPAEESSPTAREIWRTLAHHWHRFAGTASGYWLEEELNGILGVSTPLTPVTADEVFDAITERLTRPEFRPRALFRQFGIEFLATTNDPLEDLEPHRILAKSDLGGRVVPTFRPDRYVDPNTVGFTENVEALLDASQQPATFAGYLDGLRSCRGRFVDHGAVSTDHGVEEMFTADVEAADAEHLFQRVLHGTADAAERRLFLGHMMLQMAGMSVDDGLVMTVHPGVRRNHNSHTFNRFGADTGHDIPIRTSFTQGLRPLLERYGLVKDFHLVLFTVDETTFSREIAPLAGFYPSVYIGAPWWFLDAPDAIGRFRSAVTETAGFYRSSGFIDDTRAFLSIPARHDTARRADCSFLAHLVVQGRIGWPMAERIAHDLVDAIPRQVFKL